MFILKCIHSRYVCVYVYIKVLLDFAYKVPRFDLWANKEDILYSDLAVYNIKMLRLKHKGVYRLCVDEKETSFLFFFCLTSEKPKMCDYKSRFLTFHTRRHMLRRDIFVPTFAISLLLVRRNQLFIQLV